MSRRVTTALAATCLAALALATPANASFGLNHFDVRIENQDGSADLLAGSHPFAVTGSFGVNYSGEGGEALLDGELRNAAFTQPPGLVGDATAYPRCSSADFAQKPPTCAPETQVGVAIVSAETPEVAEESAVYNLVPPPGVVARFGFAVVGGVPVIVDAGIQPNPPYSLVLSSHNAYQVVQVFGVDLSFWGVPADPAHDPQRFCAGGGRGCASSASADPRPLITLPESCQGPQKSSYVAESWEGETDNGAAFTHDLAVPPAFASFADCGALAFGFHPQISARPTTVAAQSATGLDFGLDDSEAVEGLTDPEGRGRAEIRKAEVTLPEGVTVNPSQAEGLAVCSEAELAREGASSAPGEGCPEASKIGTIEVQSPVVGEPLSGGLYVAKPYENLAGDSLIALYFVIRNPNLGIVVKQAARVEPDAGNGSLKTIVEDIPQLPFSHFSLHFREGARAPLISPPGCGAFDTVAKLYPWSGAPPVTSTSTFQITSGPGGGGCPSGAAPFHPGFSAGTESNQAGSFSPLLTRLTREDGEQDLTRFSAQLPPGLTAKPAGVAKCPEAAIALARARQGRYGGETELAHPSCPAGSQIGTVRAAAGVGSALTYVAGSLYLAGPYNGAPISAVAVVPAVAGPFDAGVVVTREALRIDPRTAEVTVDGSASDPIPHILKGIPLNVRDIRVDVDRPGFSLNPTSCRELSFAATLWGGGTVLHPAGETPVSLSQRFQAAGCASLGFAPRLALRLQGGTRRGAHPALRAIVTPRPGDANFSRAIVTLPHSAFLDQAHIRTICTRVQFAAGAGHGSQCPAAAVYGHAKAWSPLLDGPATGPVYLRSSNHNLPDLVVALKGPASAPVDIELASRIDSVKGGIRSIFTAIPDLPVSRFVLAMQGGKKGLIVNSTNLCKRSEPRHAPTCSARTARSTTPAPS